MTYDTQIRVCSPVDPRALMAAAAAAGGGGRPKRRDFGEGRLMLDAATAAARVTVHWRAGGALADREAGDEGPAAYVLVRLTSGSSRGLRRPARHQEMLREIGAWLDQRGARWYWCDPQDGGPWQRGGHG